MLRMGCHTSKDQLEAANKSKEIDRLIKTETKGFRDQIKLLLLGAGESGKSTVVKQMVIIHKDGYQPQERIKFVPVIHRNVLQSIFSLVNAMEKLKIEYEKTESERDAKVVLAAAESHERSISQVLGEAIVRLWQDKGLQNCFSRSREFQLIDSAGYFLDGLENMLKDGYVPTQQDVLRSRVMTTGITETKFFFKGISFLMVDVGGQRTERRKWIHCFEDVTAIIFVAALSGYDQMLREDAGKNRIHESMVLFDSICNNAWFASTAMILFLNKKDLFLQKIEHSPLTICFPEYTGKNNYSEASVFMRKQFEDLNKNADTKEIYSHFTCATDTQNIEVVFDAVADVITKSNMMEIGLI